MEKPILKTKHGNIHVCVSRQIIKCTGMPRKDDMMYTRNIVCITNYQTFFIYNMHVSKQIHPVTWCNCG